MDKFHQYARIAFVGGLSVAIVANEQDPHIHEAGPRGAIFEPVVTGTSSSWSIYLGTGTTFGR